jgi:hypothetical protein
MEVSIINVVPLLVDDNKFLQIRRIWRVFIKNIMAKKLSPDDFNEITKLRLLIHKIVNYNKLYDLVKEKNNNNASLLFSSVLGLLKYATDDLLAYILVVLNLNSSDLATII